MFREVMCANEAVKLELNPPVTTADVSNMDFDMGKERLV